jgi:hypothetical protein
LKKQDKRDWKTLDELFEIQSSVWEILVANESNVTNWQEHKLVYNCPFYLKNNLFKHNMALAALKFENIPLENQKEDVVLKLLKLIVKCIFLKHDFISIDNCKFNY